MSEGEQSRREYQVEEEKLDQSGNKSRGNGREKKGKNGHDKEVKKD